jgi:hypothetical protein
LAYTRFGLVAKDILDQMLATAAVRVLVDAIAAMILHEIVNLLLARQLCGRLAPQELLKELDPLEDPSRPFADGLCRGLCCHCHLDLYVCFFFR